MMPSDDSSASDGALTSFSHERRGGRIVWPSSLRVQERSDVDTDDNETRAGDLRVRSLVRHGDRWTKVAWHSGGSAMNAIFTLSTGPGRPPPHQCDSATAVTPTPRLANRASPRHRRSVQRRTQGPEARLSGPIVARQ